MTYRYDLKATSPVRGTISWLSIPFVLYLKRPQFLPLRKIYEYQSSHRKIEAQYAHQPEFVQAVKEVAITIKPLYDAHPEYEALKIFERLVEPDRIFNFRINWENDQGEVQVNRGWRVQFNNALGPYKGVLDFIRL